MSSPLVLKYCLACLGRLTRMAYEMGGTWPYSCSFVG